MLSRRSLTPFIPAFLLLSPLALPGTAAWAQEALGDPFSDTDTDLGEDPGRYAMVRTVEGSVTLFKDGTAETLERGLPVAGGDVVESHGRGILQLGDGTLVAFGPGTRLRIEVLDAEGRDGQILLALERGRLRIRRPVRSDAMLRVETPAGAASLEEGARGDMSLETEEGGRTLFRIHGGRGTFANDQGSARLFAGERLTVYGPHDGLDRVADFNTYGLDGFDAWAGDLMAIRPGAPHVPASLRWYAGDLDTAGAWVYVDEESTWCWRPRGVDADWRPYLNGRWGAFRGGLTWISREPWGYVTHHHGRWGWSGAFGWYWIPGAAYSPAWVAWGGEGAWMGWAPLGRHNRPSRWAGGAPCWHVVDVRHAGAPDLFRHLRRDHRGFDEPGRGSRPWHGGRLLMARREWGDPDRVRQVLARPEILRQREVAWHGSAPGRFRRPEPPRGEAPRPMPLQTPPPFRPEVERPIPRPFERPRTDVQPRPAPPRQEAPAPRQEAPPPRPGFHLARPSLDPPRMERREERREDRREEPREARPEPPREAPRMEREERREAKPEPRREAPRMDSRPWHGRDRR